ncbi:MAG: hypothetical protein JW922_00290, partial [Paludibacteraceae bacterium]|nr:hypothetical protein [Paludibacteraceae bacterium]
MNPFALSGLLTGITSFAMGVFVYFKNPKNKVNRLWSLFTFSVAIWGFGAFKIGITKQPDQALIWWKVAHIGVILIPVLFIHFINTFLARKEKWLVLSVYVLGAFFLIANFTGILIKNVRLTFDSFYYDGRPPTLLYTIFT